MKSMSNRLFLTFMLLLGTILAVLMIVIGQLFPVYIEQYNEQATTEIRTSMDQVIDERKMDLTKEDQEALYAAQAMERDESLLNYVRARLYGVLAILFTITLILIAINLEIALDLPHHLLLYVFACLLCGVPSFRGSYTKATRMYSSFFKLSR